MVLVTSILIRRIQPVMTSIVLCLLSEDIPW